MRPVVARRDDVSGPVVSWALAALVGGIFAIKIALALTLAGHPLLQPEGELDAGEYWRLAQRVGDGDVLLRDTPFYVSPLYIYWLAFARAVTGGGVAGVLVLQAALGSAAVWLAARTASLWAEPAAAGRAALLAGGALALTGIVALQEALILQSALDALLMALLAFTFSRALQVATPLRWGACGVALALLATNRPNAWLLAVPCLGAAMCARRANGEDAADVSGRSRAAVAAACLVGVAIVFAPLAIRTAVATGEWQVLPGHGGLNLYIGNHPTANGTYTVIEGIRPSIAGQREDMRRMAERAAGHDLTDAAASSWFVGQSVAWWGTAPAAAVRLLAYKVWLATHSWELPVNVSYAWFREHTVLLKVLPVGAWLLIPIGLGAVVAGPLAVSEAQRSQWRWFASLLPIYLFSVALFFVVDRYRSPALILGAVLVGVVASTPRSLLVWRDRRVLSAAALAAVTLAAGLVPLPFQLGEADADTRMALHAIDAGRDDEGRAWLARAVARHPAPGVAWFRAGLAWQSRNHLADAERALREAHRLDPEVGDVSFALAGVLLSEGKGADAVPLLEQADRAGVRPDRVRPDLSLALWQAGERDRAREVLQRGVPAEGRALLRARALASADAGQAALAEWLLNEHRRVRPGDAEVSERLGLLRASRRDTAGAATLFEESTRLDPTRATARFNLAIARLQQGRRDEAVALLREALRIDPTYAQAAGALRELLGTPD
jgi:Flp pilus assembly protein TadD